MRVGVDRTREQGTAGGEVANPFDRSVGPRRDCVRGGIAALSVPKGTRQRLVRRPDTAHGARWAAISGNECGK